MKILFLSRWFPIPVDNGSKLRIYNLLRGLAKHHDVTLLSFADQPQVRPDTTELKSICSDVHVVPWHEFNPQSRRAKYGLFGLKPRFLVDTYSSELAGMIRSLLSKNQFDLIIASQLSMASYYPCFGGVPAMFEELELGLFHDKAAFAEGLVKRLRLSLTWLKLRMYLAHLLDFFSACTVVSEQEQQLFIEKFPMYQKKVNTIPNCIYFEDYQGLNVTPAPNQLIYSGSFRFHANYEAMQWFVSEVYPRIIKQVPETRLVITGDHASLPLPFFPSIILAGYVEEIKPIIASSSVSLAPLLIGGGTRLKILEAMSLGTPVVATSKGAEGLNATPGEHLLIADTPDEFADHVIALLEDNDLHEKLSANGKLFVKENYNWQSVMPRFLSLVDRIGSGRSGH